MEMIIIGAAMMVAAAIGMIGVAVVQKKRKKDVDATLDMEYGKKRH